MRVRFLKNRNWTAPEDRRQTTAYKAGMELTVKRAWGEQMVKDGDAVEIDVPPRPVEKKPLTAAQIKALDGDRNGAAGGTLPKAGRK